MQDKRWNQIKTLFNEAYEKPNGERTAFLEAACADDPELLAEVRSLLDEEDSVHSILDAVAIEATGVLDQVSKSGSQIGPYILKEQLGVGGMGEVYLAERADGQFEQLVALKLVRAGARSEQVLARFRSERQILARLQHPHIARLLDGGLSDNGEPYFVLEYVVGRPIDQYANEEELGIDARLRLFDQVCRAVTYAHANLVVHRDLKPSNILVTDDGQVKLLDFGIAKMLSASEGTEEASDAAPLTRTGMAVMTPAYASPEQARGESISTATDIYSLGVVLYELLTGLRPYQVSTKNPLEAARVICEVDPARPSTAVTSTERTSTTTHGSDTGRLRRLLSGDLDVICLKALRKEPERRYTTSDELGEDIRRHLSGRPIAARSESVAYRASKFVKRHRAGMALAVIIVVLSIFYTIRLSEERDIARREAEKAEQVSEFLKQVFSVANPSENLGETLTAREILDEGADRMESDLADEPEILADMLDVIGDVYRGLGLYESSLNAHLKAAGVRDSLFGTENDGVARSLRSAGLAYKLMARHTEADSMYRKAIEIRLALHGSTDVETADILSDYGNSLDEQGQLARAESVLTVANQIRNETVGPNDIELASIVNNLARVYHRQSKFAEADSMYYQVDAILRAEYGDVHPDLAAVLKNHADTKRELGDLDAAEAMLRESVAIRREVYEPGNTSIGLGLSGLGRLLVTKGEFEEAKPIVKEAYEIQLAALGPEHSYTAAALSNLSVLYTETGEYAKADSLRRVLLEMNRARFGNSHPWVAADLGYLASLQLRQGLLDEAAQTSREALRVRRETLGQEHHLVALDLNRTGEIELGRGNMAEARRFLEEALAMRIKILGEDHERTQQTEALLAKVTD